MTYGTFTNTYLVGRKIVPFVTGWRGEQARIRPATNPESAKMLK
jgi:hypothetical protein